VVRADGDLEMRRVSFFRNFNSSDSGKCVATDARGASTLVEEAWFEGNVNDASYGSATVCGGDLLTIRDTTFTSNINTDGGSAVLTAASVDLSDTTITTNVGSEDAAISTPHLWARRVVLDSNTVDNPSVGSAIGLGEAELIDVRVTSNTGGVAAVGMSQEASIECTCCDFGSGVSDNVPGDVQHGQPPVLETDAPLDFSF